MRRRSAARATMPLASSRACWIRPCSRLPKKFRYVDDEDEQLVDSLRSDMEERVAINGHTPDFGSTAMLPPEGLDLKDYLGNLEQGLITP